MNYSKLLITLSILAFIVIGCGTESNTSKESLNWASESLESLEINSLEINGNRFYLASNTQLFSKEINLENEWNTLELHINPDTSEFGDILFHGNTLFVVVRNIIEYHELPNDYITLYKSNDQGFSWEPIQVNLEGREVPYVLNRIAIGTDNFIYADWHIIFKSTDGGVNWDNLSEGQQVGVSEFLYVSKDHPTQVWTGGWNNTFSPYLAKSSDGGENWELLNENIGFNTDSNIYATVIHKEDEETVLAGFGGATNAANVIRKSEDGGETWETVLTDYNIRSLKNSEVQANRVYASGRSPQGQLFVAISDDYGDSWEVETYDESPSGIQTNDMVVAEVNGNETIYFGTNKGVYSLSFE